MKKSKSGSDALEFLAPYRAGEEIFELPSGGTVAVPKYFLTFKPWKGKPIAYTYNNKAVIDFNGEPVFAELAILRLFQANGWDGVWVDSYRRAYRTGLPKETEPVQLPARRARVVDAIRERAGGKWGGCWDVYVWKGSDLRFVESKRRKKDWIQDTQRKWLEAAIALGYAPNLLLIEWDL